MKEVSCKDITTAVKAMAIEMSYLLPNDVRKRLEKLRADEDWDLAKTVLDSILENADIAKNRKIPMCQDTGMVVAFVEIGQEVKS